MFVDFFEILSKTSFLSVQVGTRPVSAASLTIAAPAVNQQGSRLSQVGTRHTEANTTTKKSETSRNIKIQKLFVTVSNKAGLAAVIVIGSEMHYHNIIKAYEYLIKITDYNRYQSYMIDKN